MKPVFPDGIFEIMIVLK